MAHVKIDLSTRIPRDWYDAFRMLGDVLDERPSSGKRVVFLDECPWMGTPRSGFLGALDLFWNGWTTTRKDIVFGKCRLDPVGDVW